MKISQKRDKLFARKLKNISKFRFDESTVEVFRDMLSRSIPGYGLLQSKIAKVASSLPNNARVYDLGSSLGDSIFSIANLFASKNMSAEIVGVDNSRAMIDYCLHQPSKNYKQVKIKFIEADIVSFAIEKADLVLLNYTLQFVKPTNKLRVLKNIAKGLNTNGKLIFSEKIKFLNPKENELKVRDYHNFKQKNGYSHTEILQKEEALRDVLNLATLEENVELLELAGLESSAPWFQDYNFVSLEAKKSSISNENVIIN